MNKKIVSLLLPSLLIMSSCSISNSNLEIRIMDIGSADCSIFICNDKISMIDTGEDDDGSTIVSFLNKRNVKKLDKLIITHFDKDHVGGADYIINNFEIGEIFVPNYIEESLDYTEFVNAYTSKNYKVTVVSEEMSISFCSLSAKLYPSTDSSLKDNNMSLITRIIHNKNSFLFTGDIQNKRMLQYIDSNILESTFLKVPYHGNYETCLNAFVNCVNPKYAAICDSKKNSADPMVLDILQNKNISVYQTKNGAISIKSTGSSISITQP